MNRVVNEVNEVNEVKEEKAKGGGLGKREGAVDRLLIHGGVRHASGWRS